jgi:hypothetical protein
VKSIFSATWDTIKSPFKAIWKKLKKALDGTTVGFAVAIVVIIVVCIMGCPLAVAASPMAFIVCAIREVKNAPNLYQD